MFWVALFVFLTVTAFAAILFSFIQKVVEMTYRHKENIARIQHGYPTLDGSKPSTAPVAAVERPEAEPVFMELSPYSN